MLETLKKLKMYKNTNINFNNWLSFFENYPNYFVKTPYMIERIGLYGACYAKILLCLETVENPFSVISFNKQSSIQILLRKPA